ncbi:response regulator [Nitratireductor indicus]|uniref:Response regulator receiver protein n=1 Tax=Nitratireductor indicus C115 TaxID=1231190 RepID=K2NZ96_9HYPH|nr:response regulator [Nitratireductor indicus]EKF40416.1 response regulator receiver protein [Nitratireductor indicus C115]MDS1136340.1 response regulator [Nitratireductor indicus]SFQ77168.1 Response regulator receiver domain-containing protein [Nitratireductor indicus]
MAKLLIVEDDDSVRTFTARALASDGHTVETAGDGLEGLEKINAVAGAYDLVLSDIRMPAMDGIEMARAAATSFPNLRLLLMTGFADQRERAAELEGTVSGVVNKPFTLSELRQRVGQALAVAA